MRYRALPIEKELEEVRAQRGDDAMADARSAHVDALLRHPGFQIIVVLLRDIEASTLASLRKGKCDPVKAAARISTVDYIREAITQIVPQTPIEWGEEELEEFLPPDIATFD